MKRGVLMCWCWLLLLPVFAQSPQEALREMLVSLNLRNAAVGVCVKRVNDGKVIAAHNENVALTPASVTKLLPTVFALQEKGGNYSYTTTLFYTGEVKEGVLEGDILLQAAGDPCLQSRHFPAYQLVSPVIAAIEKAGIRKIKGYIRVLGAEEGSEIPGSWPWEDISNYYAALYLPFNYRDNTCVLEFQSGKAGDSVRLKSVTPVLPGISIVNQVIASATGGDNAWIFGGPYSRVWYVKGSIPRNRPAFQVKGAMHRPAEVFIYELSEELRKKGITVEEQTVQSETKSELLTLRSPVLEEIVFHTNKASNNLYAEALGVLVAPENWPQKVSGLLKKAGIPADGITLKDACGLSPMDAVPARVFTDLLIYAYTEIGDPFLKSLPVAGVDGGLSGYCLNQPLLKNNLKAKTGSMAGVRCLSGYLTTRSGEQLAFTILINHYTCTASQLQQTVRKFLSALL